MKKEYLIFALFALFVWASRDNIPPQYQIWKKNDTLITVQNSSGQDLADVVVHAWALPHSLGSIRKDKTKSLKIPRLRDETEIVIRFKYGTDSIERYAGTLDEASNYQMNIVVNFAGVVTAEVGSAQSASDD
jgi:hypothetical protein